MDTLPEALSRKVTLSLTIDSGEVNRALAFDELNH
jgi:hypothetical protein